MRMPGFDAESSLDPAVGRYRGQATFGGTRTGAVVPMLEKLCTNCEQLVGGFGGIRSCCQRVWKWNPATKRLELSWECTFESCTPLPKVNDWLAFPF
jgi:hypothetical protein